MLNKSEAPLFGYWFWAAKAYFYGEFVCYDKTVYHWNCIGKVSICLQSAVIYTTEMSSKRFFKAHQINLNSHMEVNFVGNKKRTPITINEPRIMILLRWHVKFYLLFVRNVILCFISTSTIKMYRNNKQMRFRRRLKGLCISTSLIK